MSLKHKFENPDASYFATFAVLSTSGLKDLLKLKSWHERRHESQELMLDLWEVEWLMVKFNFLHLVGKDYRYGERFKFIRTGNYLRNCGSK